jgi:tRNA modification GTPase
MYADDTIAAVATPPGAGGIGIIRVSGPLSATIAARVFAPSSAAAQWESHHLHHGRVTAFAGQVLDEGLAVLMRGPRSYTGEDVLELHCHGSPVLLRRVLAEVLDCGARLAEPGEFTRRAFLNGRLDLTQAEAVLDLVRARTTAGAALATQQLGGQLSAHLAGLRARLIGLKALLEVQIDFSEEDADIPASKLLSTTDACLVTIQDLVNTFERGMTLRDGLRVAIIGKPNVGKSSLLNALLGEDRAIVTAVAGTTRDTIDETADFDGVPVVLSDTAGLREAAHADAVERLGIERTTAKIAQAQLLLKVLDAAAPLDEEDIAALRAGAGLPHVVVLNKIDLPQIISGRDVRPLAADGPIVSVSATERLGLPALRQAVTGQSFHGQGPAADASVRVCTRSVGSSRHAREDGYAGGVGEWIPASAGMTGREDPRATVQDSPVLTSIRHRDALQKALRSLVLARESIADGRPAELVSVDVQDAIDHIGEITGQVTSEDVLDRIFSEFCIGK